jgi:dinuclear metal center YbgI/SA1388 family protein
VSAFRDVVAALERRYDPAWAQPWDAVGLVCGDPDAAVRGVLFAVDPVAEVAQEARDTGADLIVTHHPLLLRGVHSVAETDAKGRLVAGLIRAGIGLYVAHTNADVADPGVSDALGAAVGLTDLEPLAPAAPELLDKVVTFVPVEAAEPVLDALAAAGAGRIGNYSRCAWTAPGTGTFLPGADAQPTVGSPGRIETVAETRIEMVLHRRRRAAVVAALLAAHPYEEPAYDVFELALPPGPRGLGRIGMLPDPEPLARFVDRVAAALPATAGGIRAAGRANAPIRRVAVCGGSGDSLFEAARAAGADVYLTADLRHHPVSEQREEGGLALVDAAHWATEWPWLPVAAHALQADLAAGGPTTVEVAVSARRTDPWRLHAAAPNWQEDTTTS